MSPAPRAHPATTVFPAAITAQLPEVERRLMARLVSEDPELDAWARETASAGGKRIRPLLVLTAFAACGGDTAAAGVRDQAIDAAVAVELVHTASLVHDDIMDEAAERRGKPSTYAAHGRDGAILVGDFLFTQAFSLAATLPKQAMGMTADACRRLCEGQLREARLRQGNQPDRAAYMAVIRDKTAVLLAAACGIGATMAQASQGQVDGLYRYGASIGHAFQLLDDVLDVAGDPQWTGKPAGSDFLAGTLSSPYLNHLERGGSLPAQRTAHEFPAVRDALFQSGAVAATQLEASAYTQSALLDLQRVPDNAARRALERLGELLMERAA